MLPLILENRLPIQFAVMSIITVLALWKGDGPERSVGIVILTMFLTDRVYHLAFGAGLTLGSVDPYHAAVDLAVTVALVIIALRANRMYTLCIAGFQIIALTAHLARELLPAMSPIAYLILFILPSYFQLVTLALGLGAHRRRLKEHGPYRAWRTSSVRAGNPFRT